MLKRIAVGVSGLALVLSTAGAAFAQSSTDAAAAKTKSAAQKTENYLSDSEITAAVKTKFLADSKVSALKIGVETNNGVVTLSGAVGTSAEKTEAVKVARGTDGVKRVVDKLTIEKKSASNDSLVDKTENGAKKAGEATKDAAARTVDAVEGTSGAVAKDTEAAAKKTGRVLSDAEITSAVKTKLAADSGVHVMDVHVDTDKGVVTLTGSVRSEAEKTDALRIARKTMGVKSVVDKLTVK
jgi:hyperosmotically inducible protein